mgnify:CR=1 FL=1
MYATTARATTRDRPWVKAVVEVERYRLEHDVTETALGVKPSDDRAALARHRAGDAIDELLDLWRDKKRPSRKAMLAEMP